MKSDGAEGRPERMSGSMDIAGLPSHQLRMGVGKGENDK